MPEPTVTETILTGIAASPGICIGKAYLIDKEGVDVVPKYPIAAKRLDKEINRFKIAVKTVTDELNHIIDKIPKEYKEHAYILETHMVLLKDKMLYGKTIETIKKNRINAEWALKQVVSNIKTMFQQISDPYIKERSEDIIQVSDRIIRRLMGAEPLDISEINKPIILIAHDLTPAETSQIRLDRIMGFVTERGGRASHTGIIARGLEIPAVMGLGKATERISNDDLIIVDGTTGVVIVHPREKTLVQYEERKGQYEAFHDAMTQASHLPAETVDGIHLVVMGNIELPEEIVSVRDHGGDGIGLYRTEFQYLNRSNFPSENELFDNYKDVVKVMAPKPVTFRTLDINGDKALAFASDPSEENPALGLRAIRYCLKKPDVFKTQLRAILRAASFGNVRIMFPMISTCDEVTETKRLLDEAAEDLAKEGMTFNRDIEVGILIEIPSAVIMADAMADMVDFFSIGTNDLIQYTLAIDRGNQEVAHLYHPLNPAIIRMLKIIADVGKAKNMRVAMCGEMASDPFHLPILLALGIEELSMNPQTIPAVKNTIRSIRGGDTQQLLSDILKKRSAKEIMDVLQEAYGDILVNTLYAA